MSEDQQLILDIKGLPLAALISIDRGATGSICAGVSVFKGPRYQIEVTIASNRYMKVFYLDNSMFKKKKYVSKGKRDLNIHLSEKEYKDKGSFFDYLKNTYSFTNKEVKEHLKKNIRIYKGLPNPTICEENIFPITLAEYEENINYDFAELFKDV